MNKLVLISLLLVISFPLFAKKILLMPPIVKEMGSSAEETLSKNIETIFEKKFNYMPSTELSKTMLKKLKKCGSEVGCWKNESEDGGFDYAALFLAKKGDGDEMILTALIIDVKGEEIIAKKNETYDSVEDATAKNIFKLVKKATDDISEKITKSSSSKSSSKRDMSSDDEEDSGSSKKAKEIEKRKREKEEEEAKQIEERKRKEEERKAKIEEERRQREEELERKKEAEIERRKEAKRQRELEEEKQRLEEEKDRKRLDKERRQREKEKQEEAEKNRSKLEKNAEKLKKARELVLDMCSKGKYNDSIKAIVQVSQLKCECEEDAKVLALKTQLLNFNKIRDKILEGISLLNYSLILDNLEAAKALDQEIVPGGTEFSQKIDKIYAIGYFAKAQEMEKKDNYIMANESYEKCSQKDPDKEECTKWLESKDKLVKKLYDKAKVMKNFNPTKARDLLRSILKLVTAEHEFYKAAEEELKSMEF